MSESSLTAPGFLRELHLRPNPDREDFKEVSKEIVQMAVEQLRRIDVKKAIKIATLIFQIVRMYKARNSHAATLFRIVDTIQPDGHPVTSVAYAVGGMIDEDKAAFVADAMRDARSAMGKIADPPPTDDDIAVKLKELAELGLEVIVIDDASKKEKDDVDEPPPLHVV